MNNCKLKLLTSPFEKGGFKSSTICGWALMLILLIVAFIMTSTKIYAESNKQTTSTTVKTTTQPEKKTKTNTREKKFIPTEKIQADTSVPFPVDI